MSRREHWEQVYSGKPPDRLGWYKPRLQTSLDWITELSLDADAPIIDVGGESTRPGSAPVSVEEELRRVIPVIETLCETVDVPVSIDTQKPAVMRAAVAAGAFTVAVPSPHSSDHDFDGEPRDDQPDVGADEVVGGIFRDGFESGDLAAWSAATGG